MNPETYFANLEGQELTTALMDRVRRYQRHILSSGYWGMAAKTMQFILGWDERGYSSAEMRRAGPRGELTKLKAPHLPSLYNIWMSKLLGQKIVFEPLPSTEEWQASEQARRAKGVLTDALDAGFEEVLVETVDSAAQVGLAWTVTDFDPTEGPAVMEDPDGGGLIPAGALTYRSYMMQDAAFDIECRSPDQVHWLILRRWEDPHDLIAKFPEFSKEILASRGGMVESEVDMQDAIHHGRGNDAGARTRVPVYEFRHDSTPACREGRIAIFLNSGTLLFSDALPFVDEEGNRRMCARPCRLQGIKNTAFGFTPIWNLLGQQEAADMLVSIEQTNYRANGAGVILNPRGSDITPRKVAAGLSVIDHTPGLKPELANFTAQPMDIAGAQERIVGVMQNSINVSAIDRGDPPASLKSGSALLFVKATTAQNGQTQLNRVAKHHEGAAKDYLFIFTTFVRFERPVRVRGDLSEHTDLITGEDIAGVSNVRVEMGNPLTHSLAGQIQLGDTLLERQAITADEYLEIVDGGGLQRRLRRATDQRILVDQENAMLRRGEVPVVSVTDHPTYHPQHHKGVLDSQQARNNPAVRRALIQHLADHQRSWVTASLKNPVILEALGYPVAQAALGMAGMMGGGAPPDPGGGMDGGGGGGPPPDGGMEPNGVQPPKPPSLPAGASAATGVNPSAPGPGGLQ